MLLTGGGCDLNCSTSRLEGAVSGRLQHQVVWHIPLHGSVVVRWLDADEPLLTSDQPCRKSLIMSSDLRGILLGRVPPCSHVLAAVTQG
jgi:hypothetical protein